MTSNTRGTLINFIRKFTSETPKNLLGRTFNHDDSVNDRSPDSKLSQAYAETRQLWKDIFGEHFTLYGAMYRGAPPAGKLLDIPPVRITEMAMKRCEIKIEKLEIEGVAGNDRRLKMYVLLKPSEFSKNIVSFVRNNVDVATLKGDGLWEGIVCQFNFNTRDFSAIQFYATERVGNFCCSVKEGMGKVIHETVSAVDDAYPDGISKSESLLFHGDHGTKLNLSYEIGSPKLSPVILNVTPGTYETAIIPETDVQMWGPVPLPRLSPGTDNKCRVASDRLVNHLGEVEFTCRTIHSIPLMMSAILVYYKDKLVVVGHLIGTDQLPLKSQVSKDNKECVSLQAGVGDRAVLIKKSDGDWGILLGRWEELRKGVPGKRGTKGKRGEPGKRGSPGHLRVDFYKLSTKMWETVKTGYEASEYEITVNGISMNLKAGYIKAPPPHKDLPENLGVAFGAALLHVLCQPRPSSQKPSSRGGRRVRTIPSDDMVLILALRRWRRWRRMWRRRWFRPIFYSSLKELEYIFIATL